MIRSLFFVLKLHLCLAGVFRCLRTASFFYVSQEFRPLRRSSHTFPSGKVSKQPAHRKTKSFGFQVFLAAEAMGAVRLAVVARQEVSFFLCDTQVIFYRCYNDRKGQLFLRPPCGQWCFLRWWRVTAYTSPHFLRWTEMCHS